MLGEIGLDSLLEGLSGVVILGVGRDRGDLRGMLIREQPHQAALFGHQQLDFVGRCLRGHHCHAVLSFLKGIDAVLGTPGDQ